MWKEVPHGRKLLGQSHLVFVAKIVGIKSLKRGTVKVLDYKIQFFIGISRACILKNNVSPALILFYISTSI